MKGAVLKPQRIAIVGAGTAGLASAIFLARQGLSVTVFDRVADLQPVGAGILLQPSGMTVLHDLGLLEECTSLGAPISRLFGTSACDGGERVILDTRYADWQPNSFGLGIHRGVLMTALLNAARAASVEIQTGLSVASFTQMKNGVTLDGFAGEFDALILADGTRSTLRAQMRVKQEAKSYPWGALWAILPMLDDSDSTDLRQWYRGCHQMFGLMPTGVTHAAPEQKVSSLFWSLPVADYVTWLDQGLDVWKARVSDLAGDAAQPYLAQIASTDQLTLASYADVKMQQWHDGRVIAIGDCAHAMSPQLGQGANMALVDAAVLAKMWRSDDVVATFTDYAAARRDHLRFYRQASRTLTPLFQSHNHYMGWMRDIALYVARHTRIGKAQAVTTLVGARTGWLSSRYPKDRLYVWNGQSPV